MMRRRIWRLSLGEMTQYLLETARRAARRLQKDRVITPGSKHWMLLRNAQYLKCSFGWSCCWATA